MSLTLITGPANAAWFAASDSTCAIAFLPCHPVGPTPVRGGRTPPEEVFPLTGATKRADMSGDSRPDHDARWQSHAL